MCSRIIFPVIRFQALVVSFLINFVSAATSAQNCILRNDQLTVSLAIDQENVPFIKNIVTKDNTLLCQATNHTPSLETWLPEELLGASERSVVWSLDDDSLYWRAQAPRMIGSLEIVWHVDLSKKLPLLRLAVELINHGEQRSISWFPIWVAEWMSSGILHGREALTYEPRLDSLGKKNLVYFSRTYSSDRQERPAHGSPFIGQLPFWHLQTNRCRWYFSLDWSGGWRAEWSGGENNTAFRIFLPEEETQLILQPNERIPGPMLSLVPVAHADERHLRAYWLDVRNQAAQLRYPMPRPFFPLIFNHWYSARWALSSAYLNNQAAALKRYGFDAFVIDAGWYNRVGDWTPSRSKFAAQEFETVLQQIRERKILIGLWSCPWLESIVEERRPNYIDQPGFYREFMKAWAIDLAGSDFTSRLSEHVGHLVQAYGMDWWKYDQEFLGDSTRCGKMKNIAALQSALAEVRKSFPKLVIENCMSGGRMINGFTDEIAQVHWIRDGGMNGLKHGQSNVLEALGAIDFLAPNKVQRWTNRIEEIQDPELLRLYCRSAMIGVWGVSADLNKVSADQGKIIQQEVDHYRRLNKIKAENIYDPIYPTEDALGCGIIFYSRSADRAAVLFYRWNGDQEINYILRLPGLKDTDQYQVTIAGEDDESLCSGKNLTGTGLNIHLAEQQRSQIIFVQSRSQGQTYD